ncbi:stage II sporulation protein M [Psychroflexus maritimus]|uniref:Stage II sporulation protein M n=1 Tax=Psychroflexus maritimus TaxID=2714865 RepID=A0A967DXS0_9FLAO|nr:stage II sporulation protein M [Psychroflexus maritimus]NGZ89000.1 stage II sporulation protein M [Psychroflexus maritimus]
MREASFIQQNKDKWNEFENFLSKKKYLSPRELTNAYVSISEDLSYAQTFYPESPIVTYLNSLTSKAHRKINENKRTTKNQLVHFYFKSFPLLFKSYFKELAIAFSLFLGFSIIGAYSAAEDADFVRLIMGDAYVNMTLDNIEKGDPMAVYKKANSVDMFLGITINNIRVGLLSFAAGILFGVGTVFIAMQNAIMLGSFQYFFYEKGLLWESVRTIWIHGTIEISVIIICITAGMVLAKGIIFPGTYTRLKSFTMRAKDALKIVISTIPFFIIAGFLEGFITRMTYMPDLIAILIIGGSIALLLYYYLFLPIQLNKNLKTNGNKI